MAEILLVGEKGPRVSELRSLLRQDGHRVDVVRAIERWRERERETLPDLILAAVESPAAVLAHRGRRVRGFPAPLLFAQHDTDPFQDLNLEDRLVDRISSPFMSEELLARVDALVRVRQVIQQGPVPGGSWAERTGDGEPQRRSGFGRRFASLLGARVPQYDKPIEPYLEVASRIADWSDHRDAFEPGHPERVTSFSALIAEGMGLGVDETEPLLRASMLHDIGKIALPFEVLHTTQPLEEGQRRMIRTHPRKGAALLRALAGDADVARTILCHHERPDGAGYYGMAPAEVPRPARILSVAEVYDAMTTTRLREPLTSSDALIALKEQRGGNLDADCVDALADRLASRPRVVPLATVTPLT